MCLGNMLAMYATFGCELPEHDIVDACLCNHPDFLYGINDCSDQACGAEANHQLVRWVKELCSSDGATDLDISTIPVSEASRTTVYDKALSYETPASSSILVASTMIGFGESSQVSEAVATATGAGHEEKENSVSHPLIRTTLALLTEVS
jgi:hypothetical protein